MGRTFTLPSDQLEALHACHIAQEMFEAHVIDASFVSERPEMKAEAEKVNDALCGLYQTIGRAKGFKT